MLNHLRQIKIQGISPRSIYSPPLQKASSDNYNINSDLATHKKKINNLNEKNERLYHEIKDLKQKNDRLTPENLVIEDLKQQITG